MFIDSGGTAIACLDKGMLHELEQVIGDTEVSLEFLPAVNPTTVVLTPQYTSASCNIQIDNGALLQTRTVMTSYMQTDVMVLASVTRNTVLLPWCSKQHFVNWVTLLAGVPGQRPVHPEWFFAMNGRACSSKKTQRLTGVMADLPAWQAHEINLQNVARETGCSPRYVEKLCCRLFGVLPEYIFRARRIFTTTAHLMQQESKGKCRRSPLAGIDNDYRRSLKKLLGITYSELRQAAKAEHWAVVWMRMWRKKLAGMKS